MNIKFVILTNERAEDHMLWIKACEKFRDKVSFRVVDLTNDKWFEEIQREPFDILLAKPGGVTAAFKHLYDERIYILGNVSGYRIFPSPEEIFIYENKRFLSYWLKANAIPHPETHIYYNLAEAETFLKETVYPIVGKVNIGASGSGVTILKSEDEADKYLKQIFKGRGAYRRHGPNLKTGGWGKRFFFYLKNPSRLGSKLEIYRTVGSDFQKDFVIFQEYIPHSYEWRVVRIGDSFFAHKKLKAGEKASGSLLKCYCDPPSDLLDFVKEITDRHNFFSQAIDIFESERGYLVNEMQCIFGQSDTHQMMVNGDPGRYRYANAKWVFETGDFNSNECYDSRINYLITEYGKREPGK
jgi:glutathione synthase/RimK-type ligase-like ATP-grasp enzyme